MNFDRISYRTNERERLFLTRLNQRYKCKTITSLMHTLFNEVIEKGVLEEHSTKKVMADGMDLQNHPELQRLTEKLEREFPIIQDVKDSGIGVSTFTRPTGEEFPVKRYDVLESLMKDMVDLERLRNQMHRTFAFR